MIEIGETALGAEKVIIVGPSHTVRWEHAVKSGGMPPPFPSTLFVGGGGLPVWNGETYRTVKRLAGNDVKILLIVGDFRFGNSIFDNENIDRLGYPFADGFRNIDKRFIGTEFDKALFQRSLSALDIWRSTFGTSLGVVHWTLLNRRTEDVFNNRHLASGQYKHPIWDYNVVASEDLRALAPAPMPILRSLYIDDNLHPSPVGYFYLENRLKGLPPADALRAAIKRLSDVVVGAVGSSKSPTLICGDSIWIESACRILFGEPLKALDKMNVYIRYLRLEQALETSATLGASRVVFIPDLGRGAENFSHRKVVEIEKRYGAGNAGREFRCYPWEAIARQFVSRRHVDLEYLRIMSDEDLQSWVGQFDILETEPVRAEFDGFVDLGVELIPTLTGLEHVIRVATASLR